MGEEVVGGSISRRYEVGKQEQRILARKQKQTLQYKWGRGQSNVFSLHGKGGHGTTWSISKLEPANHNFRRL